jgi:DNA-binding transcriptional regulator YhcF (GntR family)
LALRLTLFQTDMNKATRISNESNYPKYLQIVQLITESIEHGKLKKGDKLPSINEIVASNAVAKETVTKAYAILRENGTIKAQHGKGFYVAKSTAPKSLNIFVLFDTFNAYKEILYTSLKDSFPAGTRFSIYFHHYNLDQFKSLIEDSIGNYNYYVVMPHFDADVSQIVSQVPRDKLLLIDKDVPKLKGAYSAVFQDFEHDVYNALCDCIDELKKYKRLNVIIGDTDFQYIPNNILKGVKKFSLAKHTKLSFITTVSAKSLRRNEAYLLFSDSEMIKLIKICEMKKWKLSKDIGLIAYDETPLREILCGGITVISTDFKAMGKKAAVLILGKELKKSKNPFTLIKRKTL